MNLFFSTSDGELVLNTTSRLLEAFRRLCPHAVEDALASLRNGQPTEHAGRVVVAAIQIMLDQFQQDASEKQKALQNSINELTGQVREHKRNLAQAQSENEELQSTCELQESVIEDLQETITIQNTILARQQRQLQSLLGNTSDDEQT